MRPPPIRSWFTGRINRPAFWRGLLLTYLAVVLIFLAAVIVAALTDWGRTPALRVFAIPAALVTIAGYVTLSIRRFHDLGWSGWIPGLGLVLAVLVNMRFLDPLVPDYVDNLIQLAILLICGLTPGQAGDNRYGPRPVPRADFPLPDRSLFGPRSA